MQDQVHLLSVLNLKPHLIERLQSVSPRLVVHQGTFSDELAYRASAEEFARVLTPEIEILCTYNAPFDLSLSPNLRWVQINTAGVDLLHNTPLWKSDISITNASGIHSVQIAEYVLGMLLTSVHYFPAFYRFQTQAHWATRPEMRGLVTREIRAKTLGILGYGAIGREVARLASACGMRILATKRAGRSSAFDGWTPPGTGDPTGEIPEHFYDLSELDTMLPQCDMLLLALPGGKQTEHIIGAEALALLPRHAFLVNIGRGSLIDPEALVKSLQAKQLGGVVLDVTEPEPLPSESPLWHMDNVLITPHISGLTAYYNERVVQLLCENLRRYLSNEPLLNLVQREQDF